MGGERHQQSSTGPKKPQQPLKEAAVDTPSWRGNKNMVSVLESDIKEPWIEIPFICLENHWLIHKVFNGVVSTTRQWWSGTGISDCFQGMRRESHRYRDHHGTVFLLWSTFLITEHKIAKKSSKLSNMTSIEYSTQCHLMFQSRLFLILIFWKQGLLMSGCASWPDVFFKLSVCTLRSANAWMLCVEWFLRGIVDCLHSSHKSLLEAKETKQEEGKEEDSSGGLQAVVAINSPQVRSRKGRWLRKRRIR